MRLALGTEYCAGNKGPLRERPLLKDALVLEASCAALHPVLYQVRPHELYYTGIVIAVRQVMVKSREAMLLASLLHTR
ncbi:MAG: hypothetical protein JWO91_185 [Acidobacteriaceae bacterium]|jgi:hypothetical protein|nr:hypothetical protein [Acidobacteriaceae bacterium]